jgi:hypothetical protein
MKSKPSFDETPKGQKANGVATMNEEVDN